MPRGIGRCGCFLMGEVPMQLLGGCAVLWARRLHPSTGDGVIFDPQRRIGFLAEGKNPPC